MPRFGELVVGDTFEAPYGRTITDADVLGFAALTRDWHPNHCDDEWASSTPFGQRIAHGMLSLSYAIGQLQIDPRDAIALRRVTRVVFKRPVFIGDTLHVSAKVKKLSPVDDECGMVQTELRVRARDRLAVLADLEILWRA